VFHYERANGAHPGHDVFCSKQNFLSTTSLTSLTHIADMVHMAWRVPGLPIRDCERSCNNRAQMCAQLSAIENTFFMIELAHAKLTHTYAVARRLSSMPVGCATVMLSVSQICWSLLKKEGVLDSPENMQFWQIAQSLSLFCAGFSEKR